MPTIMSDHDIEGQFAELVRILQSPSWSDWWADLDCKIETFATLGLSESSPDAVVWES